jgi:predicted aldo/keto reductase-like oxidoreductase
MTGNGMIGAMKYRRLGSKGPELSILGFGCMRLPVINGDEGRIEEAESTRLLHKAIDCGVNYVDTAYPYHQGNSELWLGRALQGKYREKVHLATKLPSWAIQNRSDCERYLNEQLQRLKTDHIDFYLLHCLKRDWWDNLKKADVFGFLNGAIKDGRIRYAGFSFHDEYPVFEEIIDAYPWSFCQIQLNYMDEEVQAGIRGMQYAASKGIPVVVMEPMRGGNLAKPMSPDIQAIWDQAPVKRSPAEWALRWVWNHPEVMVVLTSINASIHLENNLAWADTAEPKSLSPSELAVIGQMRDKIKERSKVSCTQCGYCLPCPQGVAIPKIMAFYNDFHVYGDRKGSSIVYNVLLSSDQQAPNCTECGNCEEACPQHIPIRDVLKQCHQELA